MGNDENPCLIKIGSILNEKEKKDLEELLMEFQEMFAWSYEKMFGIDLKIAQHHIDTHDHMVLVKKKIEKNEDRMVLKNQRGSH